MHEIWCRAGKVVLRGPCTCGMQDHPTRGVVMTPTHTVKIYGASDDLIEVEGDAPGCDEYNTQAGVFVVTCLDGSVCVVRVAYRDNGCWLVSAWPIDEGVPMPFATIRGEGNYSTSITISGVTHVVRQVLAEGEGWGEA